MLVAEEANFGDYSIVRRNKRVGDLACDRGRRKQDDRAILALQRTAGQRVGMLVAACDCGLLPCQLLVRRTILRRNPIGHYGRCFVAIDAAEPNHLGIGKTCGVTRFFVYRLGRRVLVAENDDSLETARSKRFFGFGGQRFEAEL